MELRELWENVPRQFCYKQTHLICQDVLKYTKFHKPMALNDPTEVPKQNSWFLTTEEPSREIKLVVDECFGKSSDDDLNFAKCQKSYELILDISMDGEREQEFLIERWMYNFYDEISYPGIPQATQTKAARKLYKDLSLHFKVLYSFLLLLPRSAWIRKRVNHHYYTDVYTKFHVRTQTSVRKTLLQFDIPPKEFVFKNIRGTDNFNIHADACVLYRPVMPDDNTLRWYPKTVNVPRKLLFPTVVASAPILIPKKQTNILLSATIYENYMHPAASPPYSLQMSVALQEKQQDHTGSKAGPPSLLWNNSIDFFDQDPPFMTPPKKETQDLETEIALFLKVLKECQSEMSFNRKIVQKVLDIDELDEKLNQFTTFQKEAKKWIV
jgi:hypothetical protein